MIAGLENGVIKEIDGNLKCKWMRDNRFGRMGVQGDGSCFFHSVCVILNLNDYVHKTPKEQRDIAYEFRCKFSTLMSAEEFKLLGGQSKGTEGFCSVKVWADEKMIKIASSILNMNLIFFDLSDDSVYCGVHGKASETKNVLQKTGLIAWVGNRDHFEPIVRIDDADSGIITTCFEPLKSELDKKIVNEIMKQYFQSCKIPIKISR